MSEYNTPWPRGFGIFLELFLIVSYLIIMGFFIYFQCTYSKELSALSSLFGFTAQARRMQIEKTSEAVVCPIIIKRVQESIELERRNSTLSKLGRTLLPPIENLLQRYPWIKAPVTKYREVRSKHPRSFRFLKLCLVILFGVLGLANCLWLLIEGIIDGPTFSHYLIETLILMVFPASSLLLLFAFLYKRRESRRYEAKIAKEMAHHTCNTEKGCVDYGKGGKQLQPWEANGKREETEKKEDV